MTRFDRCMEVVARWEGGFSDHPQDNGGPTQYGITIATLRAWRGHPVTREDVQNLTRKEANAIFASWYWQPVRADDLPPGVDLVAFDFAVNSGPTRAARFLQRALGVEQDGIVGKGTIIAAKGADPAKTINRMCDDRLDWLKRLNDWPHFGKGWTNRVEDVRREALAMAAAPVSHPDPMEARPNPLAAILAALAALLARIFGRKA